MLSYSGLFLCRIINIPQALVLANKLHVIAVQELNGIIEGKAWTQL